ncbi:TPA: GNAT family N-acetyltransferase [Klebsiella pneumoniae]|nr:GNAT family N-acetyltransferase [Klebsiella pneumoniae]
MLTCESVRSTDSPHFAMLDALYARAFPWHEQRESEAKRQALSHPRYALEAWFDEGVFVGLSGCWQFAGYGYIEHLAIAHKRLRFYQSMGFHANPWAHHHPSYHQGIADHELLVLSYPQPIDERQYQQFARDLGHEVMGRE